MFSFMGNTTSKVELLIHVLINGIFQRLRKPSPSGEHLLGRCDMSHDDIERKRVELEMSLANEIHMSDKSKYELIRKIMDVLEDAMEDDKRLDDD